MELPPAWSQICSCGRSFSVPQAYTCHKRSCTKSKKRLAGALEKAKEVWQAKKRQKVDEAARETSTRPPNLNGMAAPVPTEPTPTSVVPNILVGSLFQHVLLLHGVINYQSECGQLSARGH